MLFKLAWRNLWRNKRRTIITLMSVFFAVILSISTMGVKKGLYNRIIKNLTETYAGYSQIHAKGYWEEQILDNSMVWNDSVRRFLSENEKIKSFTPRIETFVLASGEKSSKGAVLIAIDPVKEIHATNLNNRIIAGDFLTEGANEVLLGDKLAKTLKLNIGDTLILLGQGYHASSAAGKFIVKGLIRLPLPELNYQVVFMTILDAMKLFDMQNRVSSVVLIPENPDKLNSLIQSLKNETKNDNEIMTWVEMYPEIQNLIDADTVEGYVLMFVLYMIITFGIFGAMLMMLAERAHEFGVLVAIGMKRWRLGLIIVIETLIISLAGASFGCLAGYPLMYWFYVNPVKMNVEDEMAKIYEDFGFEPIIQTAINPDLFLNQTLIVFLIASVISLYPFFKLLRLDALKSMRK